MTQGRLHLSSQAELILDRGPCSLMPAVSAGPRESDGHRTSLSFLWAQGPTLQKGGHWVLTSGLNSHYTGGLGQLTLRGLVL